MVYKYELPLMEESKIEMPSMSDIMSAEFEDGKVFIYALIDIMQPKKTVYFFRVLSTRQHIDRMAGFKFFATVAMTKTKIHIFSKF
jgi:hypothetical protein